MSSHDLLKSPRVNRKPSDTFDVVGSRIEHSNMDPFTMFVKGSRNYRRTPVLYKYPRYPPTDVPSPRVQYEEAHQHALDQFVLTQTKPAPPPSRSAQPFPTGDLTTLSGTAGNMYEILRGARLTSCLGGAALDPQTLSPPHTVRGELLLTSSMMMSPPPPTASGPQSALGCSTTTTTTNLVNPQWMNGSFNTTTAAATTTSPLNAMQCSVSSSSSAHHRNAAACGGGDLPMRLSPKALEYPTDHHLESVVAGGGGGSAVVSPMAHQSMRSLPLPPLSFGQGYDCGSTRSPIQRSGTTPRSAGPPPLAPPPLAAATMTSPHSRRTSAVSIKMTPAGGGASSGRCSEKGVSPPRSDSPPMTLHSGGYTGGTLPSATSSPATTSRPMSSKLPGSRKHLVVYGPGRTPLY